MAESLESIKNSLKKSHEELQGKLTESLAECEKVKRELYTSQKLLASSKQIHEQYVKDLKEERLARDQLHQEEIAEYQMQYEDLRTRAVTLSEKIGELDATIETLSTDLSQMTLKKEDLEERLATKVQEFDDLSERFDEKCRELYREKEAHQAQVKENQKLTGEIHDLKRQIVD